MKKNKIIALVATLVVSTALLAGRGHGGGGWGWGGFGAGLATGAIVGSAAASQPRDPYYYQDRREARIDSYQRQIDRLQDSLARTNNPRERARIQSRIDSLQRRIDNAY